MTKNRIGFGSDFILSNGNVGIGTTNPTAKLNVIGDASFSGIVSATSFDGNNTLPIPNVSIPDGSTATYRQFGKISVGPKIGGVNYPTSVDPYASNVSLLLHGGGGVGSTVFTDDSGKNQTFIQSIWDNSPIEDPISYSSSQSKFSSTSIFNTYIPHYLGYYQGVPVRLESPTPSTDYGLFTSASGDFTVETWIYLDPILWDDIYRAQPPRFTILQFYTSSPFYDPQGLYLMNDPSIVNGFKVGIAEYSFTFNPSSWILNPGSSNVYSSTIPNFAGSWHHIAWTRTGPTTRIFVDGTAVITQSNYLYALQNNASNYFGIGALPGNISPEGLSAFAGYLEEVRITKGISRYSSDFTPPTAPFLNGASVTTPYSIDNFEDVDTSTSSSQNGQVLTWNSSTSQWVPRVVGTGASVGLVFNPTTNNTGIGTTNPTNTFHVRGGIRNTNRNSASTQTALHINTTTGDIAETASSRRFKRNIEDYTKGLETLVQLRPVSFNFLEDDLPNAGLIAEEVHELDLPEIIRYDENNTPYSIPYDNLSALYINSFKELNIDLEEIENDILEIKSHLGITSF